MVKNSVLYLKIRDFGFWSVAQLDSLYVIFLVRSKKDENWIFPRMNYYFSYTINILTFM